MNNSNNNERMWASSHSSELLLSSLPDATLRTQSFSLDSPAEARPPMQQPPLSPEWRPLSQGFATEDGHPVWSTTPPRSGGHV